ncbi:MAG: CHAT domain-containing protein [Bacteroidota bacterium]
MPRQSTKQFAATSRAAYALYQYLLESVTTGFTAKELILIPDGKIALLPFDVLLTEPVFLENVNHQNLPFLIKSKTVRYDHSITSLYKPSRASSSEVDPVNVVAFAPSFDQKPEADQFGPLLWNQDEVRMISNFFECISITGHQASEASFRRYLGSAEIIHIATHAVVDHDRPLESKIVFSSAMEGTQDDGYLHFFELFNDHINADMVVLSACNTGFGTVQKGEGVMSLGNAFAYAGVSSVVMSHWQIDDKSTFTLMQEFYRNLAEGISKSEALREAKLSMLSSNEVTYANPYYWGSFVLYGQDDPVMNESVNWLAFLIIFLMLMLLIAFVKKKYKKDDNLS